MRQIEITVKVDNSLDEVHNILEKQGFKLIRTSRIEDMYLKKDGIKLGKRNILKVLSNCVLIRYLKVGNDEFKKITYKKKDYKNNKVLSEIKYNVNIDDIEKAYNLFLNLGFTKIVDVKYDVIVYEKEGLELAFQNVEGLGLLLEVENSNDFTGISDKDIIKEKRKMVKELAKLGLKTSKDYDVKKAYELIKLKI